MILLLHDWPHSCNVWNSAEESLPWFCHHMIFKAQHSGSVGFLSPLDSRLSHFLWLIFPGLLATLLEMCSVCAILYSTMILRNHYLNKHANSTHLDNHSCLNIRRGTSICSVPTLVVVTALQDLVMKTVLQFPSNSEKSNCRDIARFWS